ncbi:MAG TPA: glycoside hydrolase family 38 C-terminal domain-containing protein [Vicinamibacterales bacterium]|nr:glycoside hydrolase family 38 C-terminal domain-containing protein [Vicinamibacterales bacterium]
MNTFAAFALAVVALAVPAVAFAQPADLHLTACACVTQPGDTLDVRLAVSNPGPNSAGLLIAMRSPDDRWYFYSPAGLVAAPTWLTLPPRLTLTEITLLNEVLTPTSLPFGDVPLVGPFRFELVAMLYDSVTAQSLAPAAATFFSFLPEPPAGAPAGPGVLHLVPHQHNEVAWLEREDISLALGADFIRRAIVETTEDSRFRFVVSQKPVLEAFRQQYPDLVPVLRELLDQGVAEMNGGFLVESDLNLLGGESLLRQALYGQEYLESVWGHRSAVMWNADAFGHPPQMPQIAIKSGMRYYAFSRGMRNEAGPIVSELEWESPDGSTVLAHYMPFTYQIGREIGQTADSGDELNELFRKLELHASTPDMLAPVGADVSERVFPAFLPEAVSSWNAEQADGVEARISTPVAFFQEIETSGAPLERFSNTEFQQQPQGGSIFPGAYATRIEIKKQNNRLEQQLWSTETLAAMASLDGFEYPEASLRALAEDLAVNQTHDYLPGTGVDEIYDDPDDLPNDHGDRALAIQSGIGDHFEASLQFLSDRIDTMSNVPGAQQAILVFNTQAWSRRDLVQVTIDAASLALPTRLLDGSGAEIPYQILHASESTVVMAFVASMPPMGYATFWLASGSPATAATESASPIGAGSTIGLGGFTADIDADGRLRQVSTSSGNTPLLSSTGAAIWWSDEKYGDAYTYDQLAENPGVSTNTADPLLLQGPVMKRVVTVGRVAQHSVVVTEMRFIGALERLEFTTTLYWADVNRNVFQRIPFAGATGTVTEGVPYGFMERGDGDYPALGWADYGTGLRGVSVLNRGLFGHRFSTDADERTLNITLLRSLDRAVFGNYPSESMKEPGVHEARYALIPHEGTWRTMDTPRRSAEFNSPPIVRVVPLKSGPLPGSRSYLSLSEGHGTIVSAMYRQGDAIIMRLYETEGANQTQEIRFTGIASDEISETNILGDQLRSLGHGDVVTIELKPQEIVTLRLAGVRLRAQN